MLRSLLLLHLLAQIAGLVLPVAGETEVAIHVIDVGEGDATLIQSNGETLLVDTGSLVGGPLVIRYLEKQQITSIDTLVLTHPHLDHIGGAFAILGLLHVKRVYDNGQTIAEETKQEDPYRWYEETIRGHAEYRAISRGDKLTVGEAQLDVLWPDKAATAGPDWNNNSLVLRLSYGDFVFLHMGDALKESEAALRLATPKLLKATILRVGHHGSKFASDEQFLRAVDPKLAIISVNDRNVRGYPARETLERLENIAPVLITNDAGTVSIVAQRNGKFSVTTSKKDEDK